MRLKSALKGGSAGQTNFLCNAVRAQRPTLATQQPTPPGVAYRYYNRGVDLAAIVALLEQYRYLILFPLACIEGPMLAFVAGSLIPLGYFEPLPLFLVLVAGDVVPDIIYYYIGYYGSKKNFIERHGSKVGLHGDRLDTVQSLWHTHTHKTMFFSKFAYGLSTPLLISAGLVHLPFRRFWTSSVPLSIAQYAVLVALGYFFGDYFSKVEDWLTRVQLLIAGAVVVGVGYYLFTRSIRKQFRASQE